MINMALSGEGKSDIGVTTKSPIAPPISAPTAIDTPVRIENGKQATPK
jgi:hypothetical protein